MNKEELMPWKQKDRTVYVKRNGRWVKHMIYKNARAAERALKWLRKK